MSTTLDADLKTDGTRFRIFSQAPNLPGFEEPETVWLSVPAGSVEPGPADERLHVVDAIDKGPYRFPYLPPHAGDAHPPVEPDEAGHFDHLDIGSRAFKVAHMYAVVRRVLDIWEGYLGGPIQWYFRDDFERVELVPLVPWPNAHSGYGFVETGFAPNAWGGINSARPYCLNFDVLAHEIGHIIAHAVIGLPRAGARTRHYGAFHESAADLIAIIACLHCNKVVDLLLERTAGNLYTDHELSRIGELSVSRQIRHAFNHETMSSATSDAHDLSLPLTGAIFDILVEVFEEELVREGLIDRTLAHASAHRPGHRTSASDRRWLDDAFREAYECRRAPFKNALLRARDYVGTLLARTWLTISADHLAFDQVGAALLAADEALPARDHRGTIEDALRWREIGVPS